MDSPASLIRPSTSSRCWRNGQLPTRTRTVPSLDRYHLAGRNKKVLILDVDDPNPRPTRSHADARHSPTFKIIPQARKKHFRHWKGPWLITCSPIGTIFDEGVRHDLLDTLPTFQARRQSGGSVRSARTRGKSCREFRAKSSSRLGVRTTNHWLSAARAGALEALVLRAAAWRWNWWSGSSGLAGAWNGNYVGWGTQQLSSGCC